MKQSKREEELRKTLQKVRDELDAIMETRRIEVDSKLVGKCFKYRNSSDENRAWWSYSKIVAIGDDYGVVVREFGIDGEGNIFIRPAESNYSNLYTQNYVEITDAEYSRAWEKLVAKINE